MLKEHKSASKKISLSYNNKIVMIIENLYENGLIDNKNYYEAIKLVKDGKYEDVGSLINQITGKEYLFTDKEAIIINVPYLSQKGILPNGCEAVSATMLLHYYDNDISPIDFVDKYLTKDKVYVKWGCRYGPDPKKAYAGDPKSEKGGWGCFSPVIIKALNNYLDDDYFAHNLTGTSIQEIVYQYVSKGIPVAVWVTRGMEEIDEVYQWQSYDKKETFLYPVREHCMVLTGFDNNYYYFNDPYNSNGQVKYPKSQVAYCFNSMGRQAVAITKTSETKS